MDKTRKSLSALRQAASSRLPPSPLNLLSSSASNGSATPLSVGAPIDFNEESANPLYDLELARAARATSTSEAGQLKRAASPSTSSIDSQMRRAAAPSTGSTDPALLRAAAPSNGFSSYGRAPASVPSSNGRVANAGNPILSRELGGFTEKPMFLIPIQQSPSVQKFAGDEEDPSMNKAEFAQATRSGVAGTLLIPALFIKRTTWGTPRRRICTIICLIIMFIIFVYGGVTIVNTLKILNSTPSVQQFVVSNMCSQQFEMSIQVGLVNPSPNGATLNPMTSAIYYGNLSDPSDAHLIAYAITPSVVIPPGDSTLNVPFQIEILLSAAKYFQPMLNAYLNGTSLPFYISAPISATFTIIVPITYSTNYNIQVSVPGMNSSGASSSSLSSDLLNPFSQMIQQIISLQPKDPASYIALNLGLTPFAESYLNSTVLDVTIPPLNFDIYLENLDAVSLQTEFIQFGKQGSAYAPNPGFVNITGATGLPYISGFHVGLEKYMNKSELTVGIKLLGPSNVTNPELTVYKTPSGGSCFAQQLLNGLTYSTTVDLATLLTPSTSPSSSTSAPTAAPTPLSSYFDLKLAQVQSVSADTVITSKLSVDLAGVIENFYGLQGVIPAIQIYVESDGPTPSSPYASLMYLEVPLSYSFYPKASLIDDFVFDIQFSTVSEVVQFADSYISNSEGVNLYIHTSPTGSVFSQLFCVYTISFTIGATNSSSLISATSGRRLSEGDRNLASSSNTWANKSISVDVTSDYTSFTGAVSALGFDSDFFGGTQIIWDDLTLNVYQSKGKGLFYTTTPAIALSLSAYDTNTASLTPNPFDFSLSMGDATGTGQLLRGLINNLTSSTPVLLKASGSYGTGPSFGSVFDVALAPSSTSGNTTKASATFDFFELYHAELLNFSADNFFMDIYFALNFGELNVHVSMPAIAIAASKCGSSDFLVLSMNEWAFQTGQNASSAPIQFSLTDSSSVLSVATTYVSGTSQEICVSGDLGEAQNFISYFLASLAIGIVIPGRSTSDSSSNSNQASLMNLDISSETTEACIDVAALTSSENPASSTSLSLGWGAVDMLWSVPYEGSPAKFVQLKISSGYYGVIDSYRIANFGAPTTIQPVTVSMCIIADPNLPLTTAQVATRSVFQDLYNGDEFEVTVTGTIQPRYDATGNSEASGISGSFSVPANTFSSLESISSSTGASSTSLFSMSELDIISLDNNVFSLDLGIILGDIGFNITVPPVSFHVGYLTKYGNSASELRLFNIDAALPSLGYRANLALNTPLTVSVIPPSDWGATVNLIDEFMQGPVDITIGATTNASATFLSQVIPTVSFSYGTTSGSATSSPTTPSYQVSLDASSTDTAATLMANFELLKPFEYKFVWSEINCKLYNGVPGSSNEIGSLYVPGSNLQLTGSGAAGINLTFYGLAYEFAGQIWNGSVATFGFSGTIGTKVLQSSFGIPTSLTSSIALGSSSSSQSASSALQLIDAAILGTSDVGETGTIPCLFGSYCTTDLIRGDGQLNYTGVTLGATFGYTLPAFTSTIWTISLQSSLYIFIEANGYSVGTAVLRPITVESSQFIFSPIVTALPNNDQIPALRATVTAIEAGYDTVFTFGGASSFNYLSLLVSAISQDMEIVGSTSSGSSTLIGAYTLSLVSAIRTKAVFSVAIPLTYNSTSGLSLSLGSLLATVYFGHTKGCGVGGSEYCLNGYAVAVAQTTESLVVSPSQKPQLITIEASLQHDSTVLGPWQFATDSLISDYIWGEIMPMQIEAQITPPTGNRYGSVTPFTIELFLTIPKTTSVSNFIDSIAVSIAGTLESAITGFGSITIKATETVRNTMPFPILISYQQYQLYLVDTDGVNAGDCLSLGGLVDSINPCSLLNYWCKIPFTAPTVIGPITTSGDYASLEPATSILTGIQLLGSNETGPTPLSLGTSSTAMAARLYDEKVIKDMLCGSVENGIVVVGLQAISNCGDAGKLEPDLTCTYPIRIYFNLTNYPMSGPDSCGFFMKIPAYLPIDFYSDGLYQFTNPWPGSGVVLNPGPTTAVTMVSGDKAVFGRTDPNPISLLDSFQIAFDFNIQGDGCGFYGEGLAMNFITNTPTSYNYGTPTLDCGIMSCSDNYAVTGLGLTQPFASVVVAFYLCHSFTWIVNGDISAPPYRLSESCAGAEITNGAWSTLQFAYDAFDHRGTITFIQSGIPTRSFAFDLDLKTQLGGVDNVFLSLTANTGIGGFLGSCAKVQYRNIVRSGPRTDSLNTVVVEPVKLYRVGQVGTIMFQAEDDNGRTRGSGGNTWSFEILDADTGLAANQNLNLSPRFVDNGDGTYNLNYQIYEPGRYIVNVACVSEAAPYICTNSGEFATITTGLFVMSASTK